MSKSNNTLKVGLSSFAATLAGVSTYNATSGLIGAVFGIKAIPTALTAAAIYGFATYGAMEAAEDAAARVSKKLDERRTKDFFAQFKKTENTHADAVL